MALRRIYKRAKTKHTNEASGKKDDMHDRLTFVPKGRKGPDIYWLQLGMAWHGTHFRRKGGA